MLIGFPSDIKMFFKIVGCLSRKLFHKSFKNMNYYLIILFPRRTGSDIESHKRVRLVKLNLQYSELVFFHFPPNQSEKVILSNRLVQNFV